jgi:hypothetical protein
MDASLIFIAVVLIYVVGPWILAVAGALALYCCILYLLPWSPKPRSPWSNDR